MIGIRPSIAQQLKTVWLHTAMLIMAVLLMAAASSSANAQGQMYTGPSAQAPSSSFAIKANPGNCPANPTAVVVNCDCYPGLANRLVGCIRHTLHNAAERYYDPVRGLHGAVSTAISAFITLGIAIYGIMMAAGMVEKINRDSVTLLIKIACIWYFAVNTQMLYDMFIAIIDSLATDVFTFSSTGLLGTCMSKASIWERMDCMIDSVIGLDISQITSTNFKGFNQNISGDMLQRGLIGTFFQLMKSSSFGVVIGLMGFFFIYAMLFYLVRVLFAFLMSFLSLTFLLIIGPIFIPMVLFRVTKQYFDKWIRLIIASCLQPILLVAFVTFGVAALDLVMFTGSTSVMRVIAGNQVDRPNFNLHAYVNQFIDESSIQGPMTKGESSDKDFQQTVGLVKGFVEATTTECLANTVGNVAPSLQPGRTASATPQGGVNRLMECTRSKVNQLPYKAINLPLLAAYRQPAVDPASAQIVIDARANPPTDEAGVARVREAQRVLGQRITQELFASCALAVMMILLLQTLMRVVPMIANDLTGEFRYTPNFMGGKTGGFDMKLSNQVSQNMQSMVRQR